MFAITNVAHSSIADRQVKRLERIVTTVELLTKAKKPDEKILAAVTRQLTEMESLPGVGEARASLTEQVLGAIVGLKEGWAEFFVVLNPSEIDWKIAFNVASELEDRQSLDVYTAYAKSKEWAEDLEREDVQLSAAVEERRKALWEKHCQSHVAVFEEPLTASGVPPKVYIRDLNVPEVLLKVDISDLKGGPFDQLIYEVRNLIANDEPHHFNSKIWSRFRDLLEQPEAREVLIPLAHRVLAKFVLLGRNDWFKPFLELSPNEEDLQAAIEFAAKKSWGYKDFYTENFGLRCLKELEELRKPIKT